MGLDRVAEIAQPIEAFVAPGIAGIRREHEAWPAEQLVLQLATGEPIVTHVILTFETPRKNLSLVAAFLCEQRKRRCRSASLDDLCDHGSAERFYRILPDQAY